MASDANVIVAGVWPHQVRTLDAGRVRALANLKKVISQAVDVSVQISGPGDRMCATHVNQRYLRLPFARQPSGTLRTPWSS